MTCLFGVMCMVGTGSCDVMYVACCLLVDMLVYVRCVPYIAWCLEVGVYGVMVVALYAVFDVRRVLCVCMMNCGLCLLFVELCVWYVVC